MIIGWWGRIYMRLMLCLSFLKSKLMFLIYLWGGGSHLAAREVKEGTTKSSRSSVVGSGDKEVFLARIFTGKKSVKTSWKRLACEKAKGVSIN
jgi:hypothetical protein